MNINKTNLLLLLKLLLIPVVMISLYGYYHLAYNFGFDSLKQIIFFSIEYASMISGYFVIKHVLKNITKRNKREEDIYKTIEVVFSCVIITSGYLTFLNNSFCRIYVFLLPAIIVLNLLYSIVKHVNLKRQ